MEGRDQLGHHRHRDFACRLGADEAADAEAENDQYPGCRRRRREAERRQDSERHADDAEQVALSRCRRARQASQRENEEHARGEVG